MPLKIASRFAKNGRLFTPIHIKEIILLKSLLLLYINLSLSLLFTLTLL